MRPSVPEPELPESYGRSRVVVLAIDPYHVHAYWEITPTDGSDARERLDRFGLVTPTWVLRFYDVTGEDSPSASKALVEHAHFDVEIDPNARSWYVELWSANKSYIVELGVRISNRFSAVCRANPVHVPPADQLPPEAPEWRKADPEHATTHSVPPSELPAYGVSSFDERTEPAHTGSSEAFGPGSSPEWRAQNVGAEQPWVLAIGGLTPEGSSGETNLAPPTLQSPASGALPGPDALTEARHPAGPERSRSVSLLAAGSATGQRPVSGGARGSGGDPNE